MNDGPLCRCSLKARRSGIRHSIYPGELVSSQSHFLYMLQCRMAPGYKVHECNFLLWTWSPGALQGIFLRPHTYFETKKCWWQQVLVEIFCNVGSTCQMKNDFQRQREIYINDKF
jgi:hypothetical protein